MLLLGVNQTILFALSMVVIAGLIGGGGLGAVVNSGLYSNPALALLGGVAIVIMAISLDRVTERIADRTDPTKRHLDEAGKKKLRAQSIGVVVAIAASIGLAKILGIGPTYPEVAGAEEQAVTAQDYLLEQDPVGARLRRGSDDLGLRDHRADGQLDPDQAAAAAAGASSSSRRGSRSWRD